MTKVVVARRKVPRPERERGMLEAAGAAFASQGFHGASMDAIAEAAGISKPMLYNYFGSKDSLYAAYIGQSGQALLDAMRGAASPTAPAADRLRSGVLAFFTFVEDHGPGWSVLYKEASAQGGPPAAQVAGLRLRIVTLLGALFDSEPFAHAFVGAGESLANWWLEHPDVPKAHVADLLLGIAALQLPTR